MDGDMFGFDFKEKLRCLVLMSGSLDWLTTDVCAVYVKPWRLLMLRSLSLAKSSHRNYYNFSSISGNLGTTVRSMATWLAILILKRLKMNISIILTEIAKICDFHNSAVAYLRLWFVWMLQGVCC
jgi:hypothetical protein